MSVEIERMNVAFAALKEHNDKLLDEVRKNGEASSLTKMSVEKINNDIDTIKREMSEARASQLAMANSSAVSKNPEQEKRNKVFTKYIARGLTEMHHEERGLLGQSDEGGGFLVPDDFSNEIIMNAYNMSEIRPIANVAKTGRDVVVVPSLKKPIVGWGTTGLAVADQVMTAGRERIPINFLQALILLDNDTINDAEADVMQQLSNAASEAIAEAEDVAFAVGNGVDQPQGVVVNAGVQARYVASGNASLLVDTTNNGIDALISAFYGLKKTYRRNATWAFNSNTERIIRKLKNADGDYLWQPPVQLGTPSTLLGRPIVNPEGMPDIAANTFPIVIGDFKRYWIRDRTGVTIQRLVERYAEFNQTGFIARKRVGGQVVLPEAFTPVKIAVS